MLIRLVLLVVLLSWIYWLIAGWLVARFYRAAPKRASGAAYTPAVSLLKPVRGLDADAYENFASFCRQDYGEFELVFGVADSDDPAIEIIHRLRHDYPDVTIRLVVGPTTAPNRKAGLLEQLAAAAAYPVLVVSDSDMRVTPDYLRRVVAPLADPQVGLVTCAYRGEKALTLTARLEALHMGATFLPSVLVARQVLRMRFALGATMALRKCDLSRAGGFAAVADWLADDYQMGLRIIRLGLRICLSDYVVASVLGPTTFRDQWDREVRWARCNRVNRPSEYPGLLLTFSTPWAVIAVLAGGLTRMTVAALGISLALRWGVALWVSHSTGDGETRRWLALLPIRDMLSALIWGAGAFGRRIVWRGVEYEVEPDGRLRPAASSLVAQHSGRA